jgi:hypothetical protein
MNVLRSALILCPCHAVGQDLHVAQAHIFLFQPCKGYFKGTENTLFNTNTLCWDNVFVQYVCVWQCVVLLGVMCGKDDVWLGWGCCKNGTLLTEKFCKKLAMQVDKITEMHIRRCTCFVIIHCQRRVQGD